MRDKQHLNILINGHTEVIQDLYSAIAELGDDYNHKFSVRLLKQELEIRKQKVNEIKEELSYLK